MRCNSRATSWLLFSLALATWMAGGCVKSKISKGAEIPGGHGGCYHYTTKDKEFKYVSQQATVETNWWDEWTSRHGKTLPEPLPPPDHWMHPKLSHRYAATMHENSCVNFGSIIVAPCGPPMINLPDGLMCRLHDALS